MKKGLIAAALVFAPSIAFAQAYPCPLGQSKDTFPSCEVGHASLYVGWQYALCVKVMETGDIYAVEAGAPGAREIEIALTMLNGSQAAFVSSGQTTGDCGVPTAAGQARLLSIVH